MLYRNLPLLLIAAIATLGLLSEGEMEHWSGIYLRESLALPVLLGASGVAVFHAAMAVGRLLTAGAVTRFGNRRTLLGAGILTAAGMALSLATLEPLLVVAGFLLVGLALSAIVPVAFSVPETWRRGGLGPPFRSLRLWGTAVSCSVRSSSAGSRRSLACGRRLGP